MKIEKIQRKYTVNARSSNDIVVLAAEDGKKLVNQDYIDYKNGNWKKDKRTPDLIICSQVYLGIDDSSLSYVEVDEDVANKYQEEYDKAQEERINGPMPDNT